uniref:Uncharacterized protein n=1 Tax=Anguilla anguilla TaxID=7936 RepID=A0A0E9P9C0_ANGAN
MADVYAPAGPSVAAPPVEVQLALQSNKGTVEFLIIKSGEKWGKCPAE